MANHHSGQYYVSAAQTNGLTVKPGKGDHYKVYDPKGNMMVIPLHRELRNGTECSIKKWFARLGIILVLGGWLYLIFGV